MGGSQILTPCRATLCGPLLRAVLAVHPPLPAISGPLTSVCPLHFTPEQTEPQRGQRDAEVGDVGPRGVKPGYSGLGAYGASLGG